MAKGLLDGAGGIEYIVAVEGTLLNEGGGGVGRNGFTGATATVEMDMV